MVRRASAVDGTVEVVHALKWQYFKIRARSAARDVAETNDEASDLVASALSTAKRSKEAVGTSGLSELDLLDKDLLAFLKERGVDRQFAAIAEQSNHQDNGAESTAH